MPRGETSKTLRRSSSPRRIAARTMRKPRPHSVEQAQVGGQRRERALHEGGLVAAPDARVEAAHPAGVLADLRREVRGHDREAAEAVMPDADRTRAAGTAGEEAAEAEVVPTSSMTPSLIQIAGDEPAARIELGAAVGVRRRVVAVGEHQHAAARASREEVHDRLGLAVGVQVAKADVLPGERRLGGSAELVARLADRLVVQHGARARDLHAEVAVLDEPEAAPPRLRFTYDSSAVTVPFVAVSTVRVCAGAPAGTSSATTSRNQRRASPPAERRQAWWPGHGGLRRGRASAHTSPLSASRSGGRCGHRAPRDYPRPPSRAAAAGPRSGG